MKRSSFFLLEKDEGVKCTLCSHYCHISGGKRGICGVRKNINGVLYSLVYGKVVALHVDPIEKKPLFHFLPSSRALSIATIGCNFKCVFCQNYDISQYPEKFSDIPGEEFSPPEIVEIAVSKKCGSIAYTYTEPTIFFEYAIDIAKNSKDKGIKNIFVTNGFMSEEAISEMKGLIDGANVDLKSFRSDFYRKYCGARLEPVLKNIRKLYENGIWIEITTLLIPGLNDSSEEIRDVARFIADIDVEIPWHISAFYPSYKLLNVPPTDVSTLDRAFDIGKEEGLNYIYCGNVWGHAESTLCPSCGKVLIKRYGFNVLEINLDGNKCRYCGRKISGVFS